MKILACDPGQTTGFAAWHDETFASWEVPSKVASKFMDESIRTYDLVVCESIVISAATIRKGRQVQRSIELIGVARHVCERDGVKLVLQTPGDAKSFSTNEKLRAMGFWTKGQDHGRDAARHLLVALVERSLVPVKRLIDTM